MTTLRDQEKLRGDIRPLVVNVMGRAVNVIEIVSYSLIILIGVRLLWVKGRAFVSLLQTLHRPAPVGAAVTPHDARIR